MSVTAISLLATGTIALAESDGRSRVVTQNRRATSEYLVLRKRFVTASAHDGRQARAGMESVVRQTEPPRESWRP